MLAETKAPAHKVIITGTGRAGTTFLVRLLTELGLDTGYTRRNWSRDYFTHCDAGLEHDLAGPDAPYIVKNPANLPVGHASAPGAFSPMGALWPTERLYSHPRTGGGRIQPHPRRRGR